MSKLNPLQLLCFAPRLRLVGACNRRTLLNDIDEGVSENSAIVLDDIQEQNESLTSDTQFGSANQLMMRPQKTALTSVIQPQLPSPAVRTSNALDDMNGILLSSICLFDEFHAWGLLLENLRYLKELELHPQDENEPVAKPVIILVPFHINILTFSLFVTLNILREIVNVFCFSFVNDNIRMLCCTVSRLASVERALMRWMIVGDAYIRLYYKHSMHKNVGSNEFAIMCVCK
jgi:hypothetical protein